MADRSDPALTEYDLATYDAFGFESEVVPLVSGGATIALAEDLRQGSRAISRNAWTSCVT